MQHMQRTEIIHARCTAAEKAVLVAFAKREGCSLTQAVMRLIRRSEGVESKNGAKALTAAAGRPAPGAPVSDAPRNGLNRRGRGRP